MTRIPSVRALYEDVRYQKELTGAVEERRRRQAQERARKDLARLRNVHTEEGRKASEFRCYWCGGRYASSTSTKTREHCVPKSKGGKDAGSNYAWSHAGCNVRRGSDEFWIPFHIHGIKGQMRRREV